MNQPVESVAKRTVTGGTIRRVGPHVNHDLGPCTKSKGTNLRSPIRPESGSDRPEARAEMARILDDTGYDPLSLGPVATALGSDTVS